MGKLILVVLAVVGVIAINDKVTEAGGWQRFLIGYSSDADCLPTNVEASAQVYTDKNGDPDFGYRVTAALKNTGGDGKVWIDLWLETPEGNWHHPFVADMAAGDAKSWYADFPQPTLRSDPDNVKSHVFCTPGRDK